MPNSPATFPLSLDDPEKILRLRQRLEQASYSEASVLQALETTELPSFHQRRQALDLYLHRTRGGSPLETLIRLFLLHQPVSQRALQEVVPSSDLDDWVALGLVTIHQGNVQARVEVSPYRHLLLAADWPAQAEADPNQVMGVAVTTRTLAEMTIRRSPSRVLDLGTGCGVLALLLSGPRRQTFAVDCNRRALHFAQFNAHLNGVTDITWLEGNLFEPVRQEMFDLIVCNPPFVIAPVVGCISTHSGRPGDQLSQNIVQAMPAFLNEGGFGQVLCNWAVVKGQDWKERLSGWCQGSNCDVWVLYSHVEDAATYAFQRIGEMDLGPKQASQQFAAWMDFYQREHIEAVGYGLITMRRTQGSTGSFRCYRLLEKPQEGGSLIESFFAAQDFLRAHQDDDLLLHAHLGPVDGLRWQQHWEISGTAWTLVESRLRRQRSFGFTMNVDRPIAEFVAGCQPERPLGDYLRKVATGAGRKVEQIKPDFLKVVRRLVELGLLVPADAGATSK